MKLMIWKITPLFLILYTLPYCMCPWKSSHTQTLLSDGNSVLVILTMMGGTGKHVKWIQSWPSSWCRPESWPWSTESCLKGEEVTARQMSHQQMPPQWVCHFCCSLATVHHTKPSWSDHWSTWSAVRAAVLDIASTDIAHNKWHLFFSC